MSNQNQLLRRSRHLATIIPASYWTSIGYTEDTAQYVEYLQHDMKEYHDSSGGNIYLFSHDSEIMLPFHELMLPHWEKNVAALNKRRNVEIIAFDGIQLPLSVLERV